jgi:hypothetical protein
MRFSTHERPRIHYRNNYVLWVLLYQINSFYHRNYEFLFFTEKLYRIQFKPVTLTRQLKPYTKIKNTSMFKAFLPTNALFIKT